MRNQCRACDHPREEGHRLSMLRTTLAAMSEKADQGCEPCSVLSECVTKVLDSIASAGQGVSGEVRIDFNMAPQATTSLQLSLLGTPPLTLSFYCSESELLAPLRFSVQSGNTY